MRSLRLAVAGLVLSIALAGCLPAQGRSPEPTDVPASASDRTTVVAEPTGPDSTGPDSSGPEPTRPEQDASTTPGSRSEADPLALDVLASLPVKGRAPRTGYRRDNFGQAWADVDRNGCDTRNDVLRRDLHEVTVKPGTNGCKVLSGTLLDPYSGEAIGLRQIQVDHVVAMSDAWQKGAQQLTADERLAFANDPLNLQPTTGSLNQRKSDSDAASWLPPNKAYRCTYVARQVAVKSRYRLWVTQAEHDAIARVLAGCPTEPAPRDLPVPATQPRTSPTTPTKPEASSSTQPATSPAHAAGCDPSYPDVCIPPVSAGGDLDCGQISERRFRVEPPDPHNFDGNHDGVGCESD